jgi:hypothetical protein
VKYFRTDVNVGFTVFVPKYAPYDLFEPKKKLKKIKFHV